MSQSHQLVDVHAMQVRLLGRPEQRSTLDFAGRRGLLYIPAADSLLLHLRGLELVNMPYARSPGSCQGFSQALLNWISFQEK